MRGGGERYQLESGPMEAFKKSRVAIVDDDPLVCETLAELIQSWGLRAEGFTLPEAALAHIRGNGCDIVLLGIFISDVSGLDLIPRICDDSSDNFKIIITTGLTHKDTAIRALKLGAFDLLEKPFQDDLLYYSILRALKTLENERKSKRIIDDLKRNRSELLAHQQRLEGLNSQLRDSNIALSIFTQNIERDRAEGEKGIALNLRDLIMPVVIMLKNDKALAEYEAQFDMLTIQIEDLTSGLTLDSAAAAVLSFTELRIASLVKKGITTPEIARHLHISKFTVRTHRRNIRRKLKLHNAQYTQSNFLNSGA